MKLGEMGFKESRDAQMLIIPRIENIMKDEITSKLFDDLFLPSKTNKAKLTRIGSVTKELARNLIEDHFDDMCFILSVLNKTDVQEIENQSRGEANAQIADLLNDNDLVSFFISSEALGQAVQSAISQK